MRIIKTLKTKTMKHFSLLFVVLSMFGASLLSVGCSNDVTTEETQEGTKVTLSATSVETTAMGGTFNVEYTVTNGLAGIDIVAQSNDAWITDIVATDGLLSFSVASNNSTDVREGKLTIKYPSAENVTLKVTQEGAESVFTLAVEECTTTSCNSIVTAKDENTIFIAYMTQLDYLVYAGISTAEQLFADDYNYYMPMAQSAGAQNIETFLLQQEIAFKGTSYISWTNMLPDTEYVLYAYGISFNDDKSDYYLSTPVSYQIVTLASREFFDVEFDVNVTVSGPSAHYSFAPIDWDGKYYLDIYPESSYYYIEEGNSPDAEYCKTVANEWLSIITETMASGYTPEQLYNIMCLQGADEFSEMLEADTKYMMSFYAIDMVDGLPQVVSRPYLAYFKTEPVGTSNMTIDLKIENCYARVADVTVTPSTNEPFTAAILRTEELVGNSDDEIINWITNRYNMDMYTKGFTTHLNYLTPDTEYTLLAFGYYGSVVTTGLFRYDFKTEPAGECSNSVVTVNWGGPYSLKELEAYDDAYYGYGQFESMGWFAMWSEIVTAEPSRDVFHCIYAAEDFMQYGEESIFADLTSYACDTTQILTGQNGKLYVMCAVTMDYRGNYSDMWVSEPFSMTYNSSTKRPLEELIDKLYNTPTSERKEVKKAGVTNHLVK